MKNKKTYLEQYLEKFPEKETDVLKYFQKMNYYIGFSGIGTSLLDIEPEFDLPEIPLMVEYEILNSCKIEALNRWYLWCQAMNDIGENFSVREWICPKIIDKMSNDRSESIDDIISKKKELNQAMSIEVDSMERSANSWFWYIWDCLITKKYQMHREIYNNLSEQYDETNVLLQGYK